MKKADTKLTPAQLRLAEYRAYRKQLDSISSDYNASDSDKINAIALIIQLDECIEDAERKAKI